MLTPDGVVLRLLGLVVVPPPPAPPPAMLPGTALRDGEPVVPMDDEPGDDEPGSGAAGSIGVAGDSGVAGESGVAGTPDVPPMSGDAPCRAPGSGVVGAGA